MSKQLADKLKAARQRLELSQTQAALAWGIPLDTLKNWENDRRTPRGLALVTINKLLDEILQPAPPPAPKPARKCQK